MLVCPFLFVELLFFVGSVLEDGGGNLNSFKGPFYLCPAFHTGDTRS